ncbi:MAG TPA: LssY C-terminal domain-containing protein, partial [Solimonas sp.]|nr:LssY C-terminal domain-containing protein [Solimonas sp.]
FSVAVLRLLFGLAWTALLGLGYRWHQPEKLPVAQVLPLVALSFVIALALQWHPLTAPARGAHPPAATDSLSLAQWQSPHSASRFPTQRQDAAGRPRQPFTVQWAGTLPDIRERLRAAGWQAPASLSVGQMLHWLTSSASIADLPVMPQVNGGEHPSLVLRLPVDDRKQYFLRLWPSRIRLDDGRPIWVGSVMLQEARSFHRILRYPVAVDFDPPLAPLLAGLPDTQHRVNGPIWLLW